MHKLFTHCSATLKYALWCLMVAWTAAAQATSCPHTADILIDNITDKTILIPTGSNVNLTGTLQFIIKPTGQLARDTCIMTFESWTNTTGSPIGGGLSVVTGKATYPVIVNNQWATSNDWPVYSSGSLTATKGECSYQYSATDAQNYRWGGRFSTTAVGIGLWDNNITHAKSGCSTMTISVPITIKGTYDGSTVILYPKNKNNNGGRTDSFDLYTMAAGEHNEFFNTTAPFQANSSTSTPYVISSATNLGCNKAVVTPAANSASYTTYTQLPIGQSSVELANFTASTLLSECLFSSTDRVTLKPRQLDASASSPLIFEKTIMGGFLLKQPYDVYGFNCTNCTDQSARENIKILLSRKIQGWNAQNTLCNPTITLGTDDPRTITASNLSTCKSLQISIQAQLVQTGNLLNGTTSSDLNNLSKIYGFDVASLGNYVFSAPISGKGPTTFTSAISAQRFDLTAPFVPGCNSLSTTYPLTPPDQILSSPSLQSNQTQSLGVFSSQTTLDKCALDNNKTVSISGLTLNPANSGTPTQLTLIATATSGPQTLIQKYKLKINSCTSSNLKDCTDENLIFKITRDTKAFNSANTAGCTPTYTNTNDQLSVGNMSMCDSLIVNHQTEIFQTGTVFNADPYVFANALATFNLTAPMVGGSKTFNTGITNKSFQVFPLLKGKCQVVVKSSIQRK